MISDLLDFLSAIARGLLGLVVALLPERHWPALYRIPAAKMAGLSAILTLIVGFAAGVHGFLSYAQRAAETLTAAALEIAGRQTSGAVGGPEVTTAAPVAISALSLFAFLLLTPLGLLSLYLVVSGLLRAVSSFAGEPRGDFILSGIDALLSRSATSWREGSHRRARERDEGPEVADRLVSGAWANLSGVDYVVLAARRKPDWSKGGTVVTSDRWYTIGEAFDVRVAGALRTAYPLTEQKVPEILRRGVAYELPRLERRAPPAG